MCSPIVNENITEIWRSHPISMKAVFSWNTRKVNATEQNHFVIWNILWFSAKESPGKNDILNTIMPTKVIPEIHRAVRCSRLQPFPKKFTLWTPGTTPIQSKLFQVIYRRPSSSSDMWGKEMGSNICYATRCVRKWESRTFWAADLRYGPATGTWSRESLCQPRRENFQILVPVVPASEAKSRW